MGEIIKKFVDGNDLKCRVGKDRVVVFLCVVFIVICFVCVGFIG